MPIREYSKPLEVNEFGACRAVGHNQLRPNVQNCFSPLSCVFNPLTPSSSPSESTCKINDLGKSSEVVFLFERNGLTGL